MFRAGNVLSNLALCVAVEDADSVKWLYCRAGIERVNYKSALFPNQKERTSFLTS